MEINKIINNYKCVEDILLDKESSLEKLFRKHETVLKTEKVEQYHCKVVDVSCKQFSANRSSATPFMDLVEHQLKQSREMFIIRLHPECQTPIYKSFNPRSVDNDRNVDSFSYMQYEPLSTEDTGFVFRRTLHTDPMQFARIKIKEKTGSEKITINNLKTISSQEKMFKLTEQSSLYDFDFKHNWHIVSQDAVQIENVDNFINLSNPEPHYLQPSCIYSPMSALSFVSEHGVAGVSSSYCYCGLPGATTPMHNEDLNFASLNQNIGDGDKVWVSCLYNHSMLMWRQLMEYNDTYPERRDRCGAHFRKKADFLFLTQLKEWDVGFKIAIQRPGDIVVTPTGVPHQVTTMSLTFNEAINFCDHLWFKVQTNYLPLCKSVYKHHEAHGHNYNTLISTPNFRPQFLEHAWLNNKTGTTTVTFSPFNYNNCKQCNTNCKIPVVSRHSVPSIRPRCNYCDKSFKNKYILETHVSAVHKDTKFVCSCGKIYSRRCTLKTHQKNQNHLT